jgi:hypothetical protein
VDAHHENVLMNRLREMSASLEKIAAAVEQIVALKLADACESEAPVSERLDRFRARMEGRPWPTKDDDERAENAAEKR